MKSTFLSFLGVAMTMATMALATNVRDTRGSISVRHGGSKRSGISSEDLEQMGDQMAARANLNLRFNYGRDMVRGVGIGGWLVIEDFITPSIYQKAGDDRVIDEWSFGKYVPEEKGKKILKDHYDNFITEEDFKEIASYGLNHVRVSFPYWGIRTWGDEPYVTLNQYDKLKEAAHWAEKYNLKTGP